MECTPTMMFDSEGEDVSDGSWRGSRQGWGHRKPAWCSGTPEPSLPGGAFSARITWDRIPQLNMGRGVSSGQGGRKALGAQPGISPRGCLWRPREQEHSPLQDLGMVESSEFTAAWAGRGPWS